MGNIHSLFATCRLQRSKKVIKAMVVGTQVAKRASKVMTLSLDQGIGGSRLCSEDQDIWTAALALSLIRTYFEPEVLQCSFSIYISPSRIISLTEADFDFIRFQCNQIWTTPCISDF
jgi:hypothetical protein